jgi:hypothetical protein
VQNILSKAVDTSKGFPIAQEQALAGAEPKSRQWKQLERLVGDEWIKVDFNNLKVGDLVRDVEHPKAVQSILSAPHPCADSDGAFRGNMSVQAKPMWR